MAFLRSRRLDRIEKAMQRLLDESAESRSKNSDLHSQLDAVRAALSALEAATASPTVSLWKVLRLWLYAVALSAIASSAAIIGSSAFYDAATRSQQFGLRDPVGAILLEVASPEKPDALETQAIVGVTFYGALGRVAYDVYVPSSYAGKQFDMVLAGSSRLGNITADSNIKTGSATCAEVNTDGPVQTCQTVIGRFSSGIAKPRTAGRDVSRCDGLPRELESLRAGIHISGTAEYMDRQLDAFHHEVDFPQLWTSRDDLDQLDSINLLSRAATPDMHTCGIMLVSRENEVVAESGAVAPAQSPLILGPDNVDSPLEFVLRRRDAERLGNALLALAGATAGLAVGFVPVAYKATGVWRRRRRGQPN